MENIIQQSDSLKKQADKLLKQTNILEDLRQFGEIHLTGAYAGNVMLDPDIDITVVRSEAYSAEEVLDILKILYLKGAFRSYFIKGDWEDRRKGKEFPRGHYIGLKQRLDGEKWVVDIWFVSKEESEERKNKFLDIADTDLTNEQRKLILQFKKYRNDHGIEISSQEIYQAVCEKGVRDVSQLIKHFE